MISALSIFDRIVRLEKLGEAWWYDLGGPVLQLVYSTFVGLVMGWLVGVVVGVITRLFLPRATAAFGQRLRAPLVDAALEMLPLR